MSPSELTPERIAEGILAGEARSIGRALTWVESEDHRLDEVLQRLPHRSGTLRLGITGAPGVGKSSLISALLDGLRSAGDRVAVLAVDPTSPVSGGALLGDRVRMSQHAEDPGVYIRSLASRSGVGGVAGSTDEAADLLERAGFPLVIIETVGVGQLEMEIVEEADEVWLLLSPESGDAMQLLKGGISERVDRLILNKSDRPGADRLLQVAEEIAHERGGEPPLATSCESGDGISKLVELIRDRLGTDRGEADRSRGLKRIHRRLRRRAEREWIAAALARVGGERVFDALAEQVDRGELEFTRAFDMILNEDRLKETLQGGVNEPSRPEENDQ